MVQTLLVDTELQARIRNVLSDPFTTNIGAPQGDSLSPVLFTIYLELALRQIRAACPRPTKDATIPHEIEYADDTDFISKSEDVVDSIEIEAAKILKSWNLAMNSDKTEKIVLKREQNRADEKWRSTKKLGTLLGDSEEMQRRKQLAAAAFSKLKHVWSDKNNKISVRKRIRLYNAYVMPILTYNASTWALSDTELEELEAFRRRQLRIVLGIRYPRTISSAKVYKTTNTVELQQIIRQARWRLFGHILRMDSNTPAKQATAQYFTNTNTECFKGRPRTTLPGLLDKDIKQAHAQQKANSPLNLLPTQLKGPSDYLELEIERLPNDPSTWR